MTFIESCVTIAEVAKVAKIRPDDVEAEARSLGLFVGTDWAGRPALATRDAFALVSGQAQREREDASEWAAHLSECSDWSRARDGVVSAARRDRVDALRGRGGPEVAALAAESARAAGVAFESVTPPPQWHGEDDGNARRLYTPDDGDQPGLLARIADRVMDGVR